MEADTPGRTGRARIVLEEHWQAGSIRGEVELFAHVVGLEGTFAPNLMVTVNPYDGVIDDFLDRAVRGLTTTLQKPYLFDVRIWDKNLSIDASEPDLSADTVDVSALGRTIAYTHESPQTGVTLRSTDWLFIDQGLAVQVTGTTTTAQSSVYLGALESMARSVSTTMEGRK